MVQSAAGVKIYSKKFDFTGAKLNKQHFTASGVCIAENEEADSGAWLFASDRSSKELYAVEIDKQANVVRRYDLGCAGSAFDIVSTPWGFAALYSKSNMHLGIVGINSDGT